MLSCFSFSKLLKKHLHVNEKIRTAHRCRRIGIYYAIRSLLTAYITAAEAMDEFFCVFSVGEIGEQIT